MKLGTKIDWKSFYNNISFFFYNSKKLKDRFKLISIFFRYVVGNFNTI